MFKIVPQVEKRGKQEIDVLARHIKWFPITKGGQTTFGKLKFLVVSMLLECEQTGKIHKLTWSAYSCKAGAFKWHQPDVLDYPYLKDTENRVVKDGKGRPIKDTLAQKITHKGEAISFNTHEDMVREFVRMTGEQKTIEILDAFTDRITQLYAEQEAALLEQAEV